MFRKSNFNRLWMPAREPNPLFLALPHEQIRINRNVSSYLLSTLWPCPYLEVVDLQKQEGKMQGLVCSIFFFRPFFFSSVFFLLNHSLWYFFQRVPMLLILSMILSECVLLCFVLKCDLFLRVCLAIGSRLRMTSLQNLSCLSPNIYSCRFKGLQPAEPAGAHL